MKVLLVKMSSMGDVVHALPAVSDAVAAVPGIHIDWVVEEGFAEIPAMHRGVRNVVPIALRRWRRAPLVSIGALGDFVRRLRTEEYDLVIDAQGLVKSAIVSLLARGTVAGPDRHSARESVAALCYGRPIPVARDQHAVTRWRTLLANALGYPVPATEPDFGLGLLDQHPTDARLMFLHGTTWPSKHWPDQHWQALAELACQGGYTVVMPQANAAERQRAEMIAQRVPGVEVLPPGNLSALAAEMRRCVGAVTVDSGPGHLAAALGMPLVALFGPTDPLLTAPPGRETRVLASDALDCIPCLGRECRLLGGNTKTPPCFDQYGPEAVWRAIAQKTRRPAQ